MAADSRDFVVVTDYPKGEQRPHKFKIAMAIFAITILIALTSKLPVALTLMTGVAGMLVTGVLRMDEAYAGDQLEDRVPDGLADPAGLGDGQQRHRGVGGRAHRRAPARQAFRSGCWNWRSRC